MLSLNCGPVALPEPWPSRPSAAEDDAHALDHVGQCSPGWAVLEWKWVLNDWRTVQPKVAFTAKYIILVTEHAFDDFSAGEADRELK